MSYKHEQVFQLFMEKLSGELSPEEELALQQKLSEDPAFREIWESLEDEAAQLPVQEFQSRINAPLALEELKAQRKTSPGKPAIAVLQASVPDSVQSESSFKRRLPVKRALSIAALFLIIITGAWFAFFYQKTTTNKEKIASLVQQSQQSVRLSLGNGQSVDLDKAPAGQPITLGNTTLNAGKGALKYASADTAQSTLSVPAGANYRIVLSDGTEVWLNAATRLRFALNFSQTKREVFLEGEAFFKVAADARRPFIVHTPLTRINVLGTSFNVNAYETDNIRTALVQGKVATEGDNGKSLLLTPGYAADYGSAKGFSSEKFEEDDELSWMNGLYYFHDLPIEELVRIASRSYGIHIILDKKRFAGKSLTGLLDRHKLADFLNDLETTAQIKYYYAGNDLYLE